MDDKRPSEPFPTITLRHILQPWREWWRSRPTLKLSAWGAPLLTDEQVEHVRRMLDELSQNDHYESKELNNG